MQLIVVAVFFFLARVVHVYTAWDSEINRLTSFNSSLTNRDRR